MELIVDDYCTINAGKFLDDNYEKFHSCVKRYNEIMGKVIEAGFLSGEVSDALTEFLEQVKVATSQTTSKADDIGKKYKRYCDNYIEELDKADSVLH